MFKPLQAAASRFEKLVHWPSLEEYQFVLNAASRPVISASGKALKVVPQATRPNTFAEKYEPRIFLEGELQARAESWHDFFNVLVWATFPETKAALNQRHYHAALARTGQNRNRLEDALTLFDEGGVLVASSNPHLLLLLQSCQWKELFWQHREEVIRKMDAFIFGHALYEKALEPYIGVTGKAICIVVEEEFFSFTLEQRLQTIDAKASAYLSDHNSFISPADFPSFPLLGMPGWSQANSIEQFYENKQYFRPKS